MRNSLKQLTGRKLFNRSMASHKTVHNVWLSKFARWWTVAGNFVFQFTMRTSCGRVSDKTHQDQQTSVICSCRWDHFGFYLSAHLQAVFLQRGLGHHVAFCEFKGKLYENRFAADEFYYNESVARIGMNILAVISLQNIVTKQMKLCFYSA